MLKLFILFSLFLLSGSAFATTKLYMIVSGEGGTWTSMEALCNAVPIRAGWTRAGYNPGSSGIQGYCLAKDASGTYQYNGYISVGDAPDCPSGQAYQNGSSSCSVVAPTGPVCATAAGSTVTWTQKTGHAANSNAEVADGSPPGPSSSPTCSISGGITVKNCYSTAATGGGIDFYCTFSAVSDGKNAAASSAPSDAGSNKPSDAKPAKTSTPADSKGNCPGGTVQAGVDSGGTPVCIGTGTNPSTSTSTSTTSSPTTTTTASDGTKTATSTTSTTNTDGSVTTTTSTTVTSPDGTVKTSQSSQTGPAPSGAGGKNDDKNDFCTANPGLTICQNSSVSGSCGQTACQGDAIQCATLRAAAAMQCAQQQDTDALKAMPQKALGDQIMAGADPMAGQIADTLKGTDVDMSHVSFDQSGFLGGGTCLANRSFVVMGRAVPVDFTTVCNNIAPLRAVMMAVALIMSYLIVGRSVVGS